MPQSLVDLATDLLTAAKALESHLQTKGLPSPTFDNGLLSSLPPEVEARRATLVNSADTIKRLALGPAGSTVEMLLSWTNDVSLRVVYAYKVFQHVPLDGSCSYALLATATKLPERLLRRFLRHAMGNHIFAPAEGKNDEVRHTAISRLMATDPDFADAVGMEIDDLGPASSRALESLRLYGDGGESAETAYALAYGRQDGASSFGDEKQKLKPIFEVLSLEPERARRFGAAMRYFDKGDDSRDLRHLLAGFDWKSVDVPNAVVVDVGGGHGAVSQFLARNTQHVRFVVQDLADVMETGRKELPAELKDRIEFRKHDFFSPQELTADVFVMRWILHDWSDKYAASIMRNLVPAMKSGTKVVLFEYILKDEPQTLQMEKQSS